MSSDEIEGDTYEVNTCNLVGLSSFGGRGRNNVRLSSIFWKRLGMPGNMQSFPAKRTTGYYHRFSILFVSPRKNPNNRFVLNVEEKADENKNLLTTHISSLTNNTSTPSPSTTLSPPV